MRNPRIPPVSKLEAVIARDFRGGLNTTDSELNLNSKYYVAVSNLYSDSNGRLHLRYGTTQFADAALDNIIGMEYYAGTIIAVGANGVIVSVDASGIVTQIFNTAIAALLPGAPSGWSTGLQYASFTQFSGQLIICNGVDKPLSVDETYAVAYLQDPATGSNANVPRAKYCTTHNNHLILAVTPTDSYTIYIAGTATTTFVGDPPPNNAANVNLSTYVDRGVPIITGLSGYRDRLIVAFQEVLLAINITVPATGSVITTITDAIADYGAIAHKTIVPLGDDILFMDAVGIYSIRRSTLSSDMTPTRVNNLIAIDVQKSLAKLANTELADHVFAIHDRIAKHVLFFIPKTTEVLPNTQNDVFVYAYDKEQKWSAWTVFDAMPYRTACRSTEGRIFFSTGTTIRYYRNAYEAVYADVGSYSPQMWDDGDAWDDGTGWIDTSLTNAAPITWSLRLPYSDFRKPMHQKLSKYISILTEGDATFNVSMYIDKFPNASLSMDFDATSVPVEPSAAVRPTDYTKLYAWTQKFTRMQLELTGEASNQFSIVAIGMLYLPGTIGRQ